MQSRSIARELALVMLGQVGRRPDQAMPMPDLLSQALGSLSNHVREALDRAAEDLRQAQQALLDAEISSSTLSQARTNLQSGLELGEQALNRLSSTLELPRLLLLADQEEVRLGAIERAAAVVSRRDAIDAELDGVMEGWRMARLPRIDQDILRLAVIDMTEIHTPARVACNEAVELAHRYSDDQGRRRINGILRRYTQAQAVTRRV